MSSELPIPSISETPEQKHFLHFDKDKLMVAAGMFFLTSLGFTSWQSSIYVTEGIKLIQSKLHRNNNDVAHS